MYIPSRAHKPLLIILQLERPSDRDADRADWQMVPRRGISPGISYVQCPHRVRPAGYI